MMNYQPPPQSSLFYIGINLDKRIRSNHPLRKIEELISWKGGEEFNSIVEKIRI